MSDMRAHREWQARCIEITEENADAEVTRLTAQRDRLRAVVLHMDDLHDYAGQRGSSPKAEIEADPYYHLHPGDMTSD